MTISFLVDGDVMGMPRPRSTVVNGHVKVYETKKSTEHKAYIRMAYKLAIGKLTPPLPQPKDGTGYRVRILLSRMPPKSFSKKKTARALDGLIQPTTKPDLDNVAKTVLDALNGVAWRDDSEITSLTVMKTYGERNCAKVSIEWEEEEKGHENL